MNHSLSQANTQEVICAAIDIGSNSTELAIARCSPDQLEILKDESTMLRLGESVKTNGEITDDQQKTLVTLLNKYQQMAKQQKAETILVIATEAMREARNRNAVVDEVERATGLHITILPSMVEAALTYYGATYGPDVPASTGVIDVGGGSTELITAHEGRITWLTSVPIGSGWLHDQYLPTNPPMEEEIGKAREFLRQYSEKLHVPRPPLVSMVTGSSAKALLKLAKQALKLHAQSDHLTAKDLAACLGILQNLSAEEIAQRYKLEPERARVLPGGALILLTLLDYLRLDEVRVSPFGVRQGVLLAYTRYGERWLEHPEVSVDKARRGKVPALPSQMRRDPKARQTFIQSGHEELHKRETKFLDWQDEVIKDEDIEAVHKMRVASRRLRAAMDAYEAACQPKPFKQTYKRVKKAADLLGVVRDTDVMQQKVEEHIKLAASEEKAGLQWLVERLATYRKQEQAELEHFLSGIDKESFEQKIAACIAPGESADG